MKWISVKDRLPEPYRDVLVCTPSGRIFVSRRAEYLDGIFWEAISIKITHWMPLPEPPKEEE